MLSNRRVLLVGVGKCVGALGVLTGLLAVSIAAKADTLKVCAVVTNKCFYTSVQQAVDVARSGDTISIGPGVFVGSVFVGLLKDLTLEGQGSTRTVLRGDFPFPPVPPRNDVDAINCNGGGNIHIRGVTITHTHGVDGPGIDNLDCTITVEKSTIQSNFAESNGGGISNSGAMTVKNSDVQDNLGEEGGGIYNTATLTIKDSHILNNEAYLDFHKLGGGGIYNSGTLTLQNSDVTGNDAFRGGGITNDRGTVFLKTSTIHKNHVHSSVSGGVVLLGEGGGIWNSGSVVLTSSLIDTNSAERQGGGIFNQSPGTIVETGGDTLFYMNVPNDCADINGTVSCP